MLRTLFLPLALTVLASCPSNGQQKTAKPTIPATSKQLAPEVVLPITAKTYPGLKPGQVAPDAVKISADRIISILNGVCVVQKGNLFALIDLAGKNATQWGQYEDYKVSRFTTLIAAKDAKTGKVGYLNTKGETVLPFIYREGDAFNAYRLASVSTENYDRRFLDSKGKIAMTRAYFMDDDYHLFGRPFYTEAQNTDHIPYRFSDKAKGKDMYAYSDKLGIPPFPQSFDNVSSFSEGLAAVAQTDKFGETLWGFIDKKGQLVIPYAFRVKPGSFHNGLALVKPVGKSDFDYAYINRMGKIILKIGKGDGRFPYFPAGLHNRREISSNVTIPGQEYRSNEMAGHFLKGYAFWSQGLNNVMLLDTLGAFHPLNDIIKDPTLKAEKGLDVIYYDDLGIYFTKPFQSDKRGNRVGVLTYGGETMFPASFVEVEPDYYSPYAYAVFKNDMGWENAVYGIVNRQGVFVLTLAGKSQF